MYALKDPSCAPAKPTNIVEGPGSEAYLRWSILGLLMRDGRTAPVDNKKDKAQVR